MTAPSGYTTFNIYYRVWLSILLEKNWTYRRIGRELKFHHTAISREIERNSIRIGRKSAYDPVYAQQKTDERKHASRRLKIESNKVLYNFIRIMLKYQAWGPDAIAGFLKLMNKKYTVSHETIYQYIYKHKPEWAEYLPRKRKKRHKRSGKYKHRGTKRIPNRRSIIFRPAYVLLRNVFGHFEADCMVSKISHGAIVALIERKTRYVKLIRIPRKTADNVKDAIIKALKKYRSVVKSITYDNGLENVLHEEVNEALECKSYFCNPYHSWEKGSVENVIGLVRRFIPKGSDLAEISKKDLQRIEYVINKRPRKILGYRTPLQLFKKEWCTQG